MARATLAALLGVVALASVPVSAQRARRPPRVIQLDDLGHHGGRLPTPRHLVATPLDGCPARTLRARCLATPETSEPEGEACEVDAALLGALACPADAALLSTALALEEGFGREALEAAAHVYDRLVDGEVLTHLAMLGQVRTRWRLDRRVEAGERAQALLARGPQRTLARLAVRWVSVAILEQDADGDAMPDPDWAPGAAIRALPDQPWARDVAARTLLDAHEMMLSRAAFEIASAWRDRWPDFERAERARLFVAAHVAYGQADEALRVGWRAHAECAHAAGGRRAVLACEEALVAQLAPVLTGRLHQCAQPRSPGRPTREGAPTVSPGCLSLLTHGQRLLAAHPDRDLALDLGDLASYLAARVRQDALRAVPATRAQATDVTAPTLRTERVHPTVHGEGDFDPNLWERRLRRERGALARCGGARGGAAWYDARIDEAGRVRATVRGRGRRCVARILDRIQFRPGPEGGAVIFRGAVLFLRRLAE